MYWLNSKITNGEKFKERFQKNNKIRFTYRLIKHVFILFLFFNTNLKKTF